MLPLTTTLNKLVFWRASGNALDIAAHTERSREAETAAAAAARVPFLQRDDLRVVANAAIVPAPVVRFAVVERRVPCVLLVFATVAGDV